MSLIVHNGTPIHARLKRENRLSGNYLRYGYRIEDRKARLAQIAFQFFVKKTFVFYFAFWRYARERLHDGVRMLRMGGAGLGMRSRKAERPFNAADSEPGPGYVGAYAG